MKEGSVLSLTTNCILTPFGCGHLNHLSFVVEDKGVFPLKGVRCSSCNRGRSLRSSQQFGREQFQLLLKRSTDHD